MAVALGNGVEVGVAGVKEGVEVIGDEGTVVAEGDDVRLGLGEGLGVRVGVGEGGVPVGVLV